MDVEALNCWGCCRISCHYLLSFQLFIDFVFCEIYRGEGGSKKDLISTAKGIAEASVEVTRLAKRLAAECTDRKMRNVSLMTYI